MGFLDKRYQAKEIEREVKFKQGLSQVRNYVRKCYQAEKRYWELGKRALKLGDRRQFESIAKAYLRARDMINHWDDINGPSLETLRLDVLQEEKTRLEHEEKILLKERQQLCVEKRRIFEEAGNKSETERKVAAGKLKNIQSQEKAKSLVLRKISDDLFLLHGLLFIIENRARLDKNVWERVVAMTKEELMELIKKLHGENREKQLPAAQRVKTKFSVNVRTGPGDSFPEIAHPDYPRQAPPGATGIEVVDESTQLNVQFHGYKWFCIQFDVGYSGWCEADSLEWETDEETQKLMDIWSGKDCGTIEEEG